MNKRWIYLFLTCLTMFVGYASRRVATVGTFLYDYVGDALWAMMIYWGCRLLLPWSRLSLAFGCALAFCYGIEMSQLYHAPWIDALRQTKIGALVLGFQFLWSDLLAYLVGIASGFAIDTKIKHYIQK